MNDNAVSVRGRRFARRQRGAWRLGVAWLVGAALALSGTAAVAEVAPSNAEIDGSVYIGGKEGYGGTGVYPVWSDGVQEGEPDYWAYCIEHNVGAKVDTLGQVGDLESYLGENYFLDPVVQGKVLWILAHSFPALGLEEFGETAGVPGISRNDAIEAAQYAIWRYTDLSWDASWSWSSVDSEAAYWHLINGANASEGLPPEHFEVTADVEASAEKQVAGTLIGPFTISTNQERVTVSTDSALVLVDADGNAIDPTAVVDGQQIYLDALGETAAGGATITVSARGTSNTGKVISVPVVPGTTPTEDSHAQSVILVTPDTTTTTDSAHVDWNAVVGTPEPAIGTTLVDEADGDQVLAAGGGTLVDTVAYENLTPGTTYTVEGVLMDKATGESTGITGSTTFTSESADGSVDVVFEVPGDYAGDVLVAFEQLFEVIDEEGTLEEEPSAVHEDINDAAQTVTVEEAAVEPTPTPTPTVEPTPTLTVEPTPTPTVEPTPTPTVEPTPTPTVEPTPTPTVEPTTEPSEEPTPTEEPSETPSEEPTPTAEPSTEPEPQPTQEPTEEPSEEPAPVPTEQPTPGDTDGPAPSDSPAPSAGPSAPSDRPDPAVPGDRSPATPAPNGALSPTGGSTGGTVAIVALLTALSGGMLMILRRRARHES